MRKISIEDKLLALNGILSMHERAEKAGVPCQLNGESRKFDMGQACDCGTAACLMGSASLHPWFKENGSGFDIPYWESNQELSRDFDHMVMYPSAYGFKGKISDMSKVTIPQVREKLYAMLLKYCGKESLKKAARLKKRGDKLRMGIPK